MTCVCCQVVKSSGEFKTVVGDVFGFEGETVFDSLPDYTYNMRHTLRKENRPQNHASISPSWKA
jgi:hypothetical protein